MVQLGVSFLSTTQVCPDVLKASCASDIPVLCGVSSLSEAQHALQLGAIGLKFYPSSAVSPSQLSVILRRLRNDALLASEKPLLDTSTGFTNRPLAVLVAGGVTPESAIEYSRVGATHFCIGYDCGAMSPTEILQSVRVYEQALTSRVSDTQIEAKI